MKRFHVKRSPASPSSTIRLWMGQCLCLSKSTFHCIFSMPVAWMKAELVEIEWSKKNTFESTNGELLF